VVRIALYSWTAEGLAHLAWLGSRRDLGV
jgi:hypothetical protein